MNKELIPVIKGLLNYTLNPVDFKFASLTNAEKQIAGSQATMDQLKFWVLDLIPPDPTTPEEVAVRRAHADHSLVLIGGYGSHKYALAKKVAQRINKNRINLDSDNSELYTKLLDKRPADSLIVIQDHEDLCPNYAQNMMRRLTEVGLQVILVLNLSSPLTKEKDFLDRFTVIQL
jgi:hypothetical protein